MIKAITGVFTPLPPGAFLYYDCVEALLPRAAAGDAAPRGDRYDAQRAVIGARLCDALASQRLFVVGAGAIGCELLKNLALMGVGRNGECGEGSGSSGSGAAPAKGGGTSCHHDGEIVVTDMDSIERSNLNRQFLFRARDVGAPKSTTACAAALRMNRALHLQVR